MFFCFIAFTIFLTSSGYSLPIISAKSSAFWPNLKVPSSVSSMSTFDSSGCCFFMCERN